MTHLKDLLGSDAYWQVNKRIARHFESNDVAILLADLISKSEYFKELGTTIDGFFYNTSENIEKDCNISYFQQKKAIKKLIDSGFVEVKITGLPAKLHFKIIESKILSFFNLSFQETSKLDLKKLEVNKNKYNKNKDNNTVSNDTLLIDDNLPNSFNPTHFIIAKSYHNLFLKTKGKNRTLQNVTTKSYVDTIRKLIELDGLTIEQLVAIKLFLEDGANGVRGVDTFWAETIYSVNSLRKKNNDGVFYYDMIAQKAKKWIEMDGNKARVKNAVEYVNSKQCKSQEEHISN